ncbi:MAG: hypothetical protein ABIG87_02505 [Patescibacteria group bacterium]
MKMGLTKKEENRIVRKEEEKIRAEIKASVEKLIKEKILTENNVEIFLARARKKPDEFFFIKENWGYRKIGNLEEVFYIGILLWSSKKGMLF